jgi:hypothetical protein
MNRLAALALGALAVIPVVALAADGGRLEIPDLGGLANRAAEHTEITIGPVLLGFVRHLPATGMSEEDRRLLKSIERVEVHAFEFNEEHAYRPEDFAAVRAQMHSARWTPVVRSHSNADNQDVDIAVAMDHDQPTGLAILVTSPRELTVINVVGRISPEDLARIGGSIGVPSNAVSAIQGKAATPVWAD